MDLLLMRREAKMVMLTVCRQMLTPGQQSSLANIARVFDKLNHVYFSYHQAEAQAVVGTTQLNQLIFVGLSVIYLYLKIKILGTVIRSIIIRDPRRPLFSGIPLPDVRYLAEFRYQTSAI